MPRTSALLLPLLLLAGLAQAQSVNLSGMLGTKALIVVDGSAPKAVGAGESWHGVKVIATQGDSATVEVDGKRQSLRVGDTFTLQGEAARVIRITDSAVHLRHADQSIETLDLAPDAAKAVRALKAVKAVQSTKPVQPLEKPR